MCGEGFEKTEDVFEQLSEEIKYEKLKQLKEFKDCQVSVGLV